MASSSRSRWEQLVSLPMKDGDPRNWADLPAELTSSILLRLTTVEILKNAQKVCRSWRRVCKDPSMWIKIDLRNPGIFGYDCDMMCRHAVDLSEGGLLEINFKDYATNSLLSYVAERSSNLRCLKLAMSYPLVTGKGFSDALMKLPFLEHLEILERELKLDLKDIEAIGRSCPLLKTLKLNRPFFMPEFEDKEALAISETMPELRHLELFGNGLTNSGLIAILDRCLHLEHLNLGYCFNIDLVGDLEKRCVERIKYFIRPSKPTDTDSAEEDNDHSNGSDDMVYHYADNPGDESDHSSNDNDDDHSSNDSDDDHSSNDSDDDHFSNDCDDDHSSNDSDDEHSSNDSDDDHSSNDSDDDHSFNDSDDDHSSNDSDDDHSFNDSDDDHSFNDSDDDHSSNDSDDMVYIYADSGDDDSDHSSND